MPKASVIIVTYNNSGDIVPCLDALRPQGPHEVIVVDNGSQDDTVSIIRRRFPDVRLLQQENLGFGAGCNLGSKTATGDLLVFLNPDAVPEAGFLRAIAEAAGPGQAATGQLVLLSDPARINTAGHRLHFTGYGFVVGLRGPRLPPGPPMAAQGVSGAAFAITRDDYRRLGGFDEDFFLYMEDTEFSWRMHRAGMRIVVAPAAVATHDYVPSLPTGKIADLESGRLLLLRKHLPARLWVAYLPSLALSEVLAWGRAAWLGRDGLKAKARGLRRGLRGGIKRYPGLARARPHTFASQDIPFTAVSGWRSVALLGWGVNLLFRLNTLFWSFRRERTHIRLPQGPLDRV